MLDRSRRRRLGVLLEEHARGTVEPHVTNELGQPLPQPFRSLRRHRGERFGEANLGRLGREPHEPPTARREPNLCAPGVLQRGGALHELALHEAADDDRYGALVGVGSLSELVHRQHRVSTEALKDEELRPADSEPLLCIARGDAKLANEEAEVVQDRASLVGGA